MVSGMKRFSITLDDSLYYKIAASAAANKRSLSKEVAARVDPTNNEAPLGREWHNPSRLKSPGEGYRFVLKDEPATVVEGYWTGASWAAPLFLGKVACSSSAYTCRTKLPIQPPFTP